MTNANDTIATPEQRDTVWRYRNVNPESIPPGELVAYVRAMRAHQADRAKADGQAWTDLAKDVLTNEYLNDAGACMEGRLEFLSDHNVTPPSYKKIFIGSGSCDDWEYDRNPDDINTDELDQSWDGNANADFYEVAEGWDDDLPVGFTSASDARASVRQLQTWLKTHGSLETIGRKLKAYDNIVKPTDLKL